LFSYQAILMSAKTLREHSQHLIQGLEFSPIPEINYHFNDHLSELSQVFYPLPESKGLPFIDRIKQHFAKPDASTGSSELVISDVLRRLNVPNDISVPAFIWPIIEIVAFEDTSLHQQLGRVIDSYMRQHIPLAFQKSNKDTHSMFDLSALHPQIWWALIALYGSKTSEERLKFRIGCNPFRWRKQAKSQSEITHAQHIAQLERMERLVLETAYRRAFIDHVEWAGFWEQWILLFAWYRWHGRDISPQVNLQITHLPLTQIVLPHIPRQPIPPNTPPPRLGRPNWESTAPAWFKTHCRDWFKF